MRYFVRSVLAGCNIVAAFLLSLAFADTAFALCIIDLPGKWQQTHTLIQGNKIRDESQAWIFKADGTMQFVKSNPPLNVPGKYRCDGYSIFISGRMTNQFKIIERGLDTMTLESGRGGTVFVKRVTQ